MYSLTIGEARSSRCGQSQAASEGSGREPSLPLPTSGAPGLPWLNVTPLQSLLCLHVAFSSVSPCVSSLLCHIKTQSLELQPILNPQWFYFELLITPAKTLFQIRSHSLELGVRTWVYLLGGMHLNPYQGVKSRFGS